MSNAVFPSLRGLDYRSTKTPMFKTIVQSSPAGYTLRLPQMQNPMWQFALTFNYLKNLANDIQPGLLYTDLQTLLGFFLARQGQFDDFLYTDPEDNFVGPGLATNGWVANQTLAVGASLLDAANHWQQITQAGTSGTSIPTFNDSGGVTMAVGGTAEWTDRGLYSASGYPNTTFGQLQLVNDGMPTPTYYSPIQRNMGGQFYEDVTDLNPASTISVYANGVLQSVGTNYNILGPGVSFPGYSFMGLVLQWTAEPTPPITATFNFYFRVRFNIDKQDFDRFMNNLWCIYGPYAVNSQNLTFETARPPIA